MASLELRNQTYRVVFMFRGRKYGYSLSTGDRNTAEALRGGVEKTLMRVEQNLLPFLEGADIIEFLKHDGRPPEEHAPDPQAPLTLAQLNEKYLETYKQGAMEESSLRTVRMHLRHFEGTFGERFTIRQLTLADLQRHVSERAKKKYRGKRLSTVTLKKEVDSLRAVWNWATLNGLVSGPFPSRGLVYPKADEKLPFMTWSEIERRIHAGGLNPKQIEELWDCLYLRKEEIAQFLEYVEEHAAYPWLYPLLCTAAHTGARRSELLRIEVADVNFDADLILIREKKRSRKQRTTRHVSLTPFLKKVLRDWIASHPGGQFLFSHSGEIARSKKRSRTTGHRGEKTRPSSLKGRLATVHRREAWGHEALTRNEAHDHFKRTFADSRWSVLRGFHLLRHSFISCLAAAGVDQRIIDEFVGHQTDEQRRRYRHLVPDVKQKAITDVFG
ncbi:MAG: tyrosine-type recombinase/integrase [Gemmataceae bacterium]